MQAEREEEIELLPSWLREARGRTRRNEGGSKTMDLLDMLTKRGPVQPGCHS